MRLQGRRSQQPLFLPTLAVTLVLAIAVAPKPPAEQPMQATQAKKANSQREDSVRTERFRAQMWRNSVILVDVCIVFYTRHGRFPTPDELTPDLFPGRALPTNPYTHKPVAIVAVNATGEPLYEQPRGFTLFGNYGYLVQDKGLRILSLKLDGTLYAVIESKITTVDSTIQNALAPHAQ